MEKLERQATAAYPVGVFELHPDVMFNFQMNRYVVLSGELSMIEDMKRVAPRIRNNADWVREFLMLADSASAAGAEVKAAYYGRAAEFYMNAADPKRRGLRERFVRTVRGLHGIGDGDIDRVPYAQGGAQAYLPAIRLGKRGKRDTLIIFGGFDSYFEELIGLVEAFATENYDVIFFEGPGQGEAVEQGIPMTYRWEVPVAAVLDYYEVESATAIGLSFGGYLAMRAAAFEPRITRAVAWDIIYDFFECSLSQLPPRMRRVMRAALNLRAASAVNALLHSRMRKAPTVDWGIRQGMHIFGESTPYGFFRQLLRLETRSFSGDIHADVLLLAGARDHYVPLEMLHRQALAITNARSLTTRIFTEAEYGHTHCQMGNIPLVTRVILDWLETTGPNAASQGSRTRERHPSKTAAAPRPAS